MQKTLPNPNQNKAFRVLQPRMKLFSPNLNFSIGTSIPHIKILFPVCIHLFYNSVIYISVFIIVHELEAKNIA